MDDVKLRERGYFGYSVVVVGRFKRTLITVWSWWLELPKLAPSKHRWCLVSATVLCKFFLFKVHPSRFELETF